MTRRRPLLALVGLSATLIQCAIVAQVVSVTLQLDPTRIAVGETATLRVYAQVVPDRRASTDRLFSWYVDLLNAGGQVALLRAERLVKSSSDQDARTSSTGTTDGAHHRGIFDTFLDRPGAGRDAPVELFSIPVHGRARGTATLSVVAGSGVAGLFADFIVAPLGGGDPLLHGDYSGASVTLQVDEVLQAPPLTISVSRSPEGQSQRVTLSFVPRPNRRHFVEFRDRVDGGSWQVLPGGPHDLGTVVDASAPGMRYYRLRLDP
jgi:hypothetical protein